MQKIMEQRLEDFCAAVASGSPSPGGGSVAAVAGVLAASLVSMVSGLTLGRKKYASVQEDMEQLAERAADLSQRLGRLADADAAAYDQVMEAYKLPKEDEDEKARRQEAIGEALFRAAQVPLATAQAAYEALELAEIAVDKGNPNARTDAGVAALLADAALQAAIYNVKVNISSVEGHPQWALDMEKEISLLLGRKESLSVRIREKVAPYMS